MVTSKSRVVFRCQECGYESVKWLGRCPDCGNWNTLVEEVIAPEVKRKTLTNFSSQNPQALGEVRSIITERMPTGIGEFDRILGGGVVPGSLILIGGPPGIGKSTLLLQIAQKISANDVLLYVSGEESAQQIKMRADRLEISSPHLYVVSETNLESIFEHINKVKPKILIIDSIQTLFASELPSAPGSVGQVRECTAQLLNLAKTSDMACFITGHVTKEGAIAGPRVLEHIVDTVLYFEGDLQHNYRILRAVKNRFGSTNEIGIFAMHEKGLEEILNPSEVLLQERLKDVPGTVVVASLEGTRPLLVELQALVSNTYAGFAKRQTQGVDYNRTSLLLAVMEKRLGMALSGQDVFVNVAGGLTIDEPACDLGIVCAVASAFRNKPVEPLTVILGEVGLAGEVRAINFIKERVKEITKLGFSQCILPQGNLKEFDTKKEKITLIGVRTIKEALDYSLKNKNSFELR